MLAGCGHVPGVALHDNWLPWNVPLPSSRYPAPLALCGGTQMTCFQGCLWAITETNEKQNSQRHWPTFGPRRRTPLTLRLSATSGLAHTSSSGGVMVAAGSAADVAASDYVHIIASLPLFPPFLLALGRFWQTGNCLLPAFTSPWTPVMSLSPCRQPRSILLPSSVQLRQYPEVI